MISAAHRQFCAQWQDDPRLIRCESIGTILALEYRTESPSYFQVMRDQLYQFFLERKILLRPLGNVLYVLPHYCIQIEELQYIYDNIIFSLKKCI